MLVVKFYSIHFSVGDNYGVLFLPKYVGGKVLFYQLFYTGTFRTKYNINRCCTTKYIFVLGKNKFDKLGLLGISFF